MKLAIIEDELADAKAIVPDKLDMSLSEIDLSLIIGNLMDNCQGGMRRSQ